MNPQTHRLIFNPHRGCLMAVAESARSCGKGRQAAQGRRGKHRAHRRGTGTDPATTQKRLGDAAKQILLGDGFYEQRLITEQIGQLTGRRFLSGFENDETQYRALMSAGVSFAKEWNLRPGVALSAEQMARLTTDIVWLVAQEVRLPNGSVQQALVPQVYARVRDGDLAPSGALIAGRNLQLAAAGQLVNEGAITGTATQISNLSVGAVNQGAAGANGVTAAVGAGSSVARITQVNTPATVGGPAGVVATVNAPGSVPNNALFHPGNPTATYLIETDPRFASYRQWISSDYMLAQLSLDPATTQKRLGDGFYEQRLITEQIAQLTGRRFLIGYQNEEEQYKALMNAGITVAQAWNLIPGVALSAEQMAQLTTDMVWLVERK
ncbi:MAG: hypothetical protein IPL58_16670 [Betaproteobacteria bacterium]|uniref:ESPR domain-containing protein n=1 Tax=Candidatus Proximibacter danicus TaxID=2954365 RepID=A0A9D7K4T4_9PROT|nr:hypothetical protein [Candidatus Proximibacter danicus]